MNVSARERAPLFSSRPLLSNGAEDNDGVATESITALTQCPRLQVETVRSVSTLVVVYTVSCEP